MEVTKQPLKKLNDTEKFTEKGFYVYQGLSKRGRKLLYIGTTIQVPKERFRWHKYHGKDFLFEVVAVCQDEMHMLDTEFKLIKELNPPANKIKRRMQNLNRKLTDVELSRRFGDANWCQSCLRRRVKENYSTCLWCEKGINR